MVETTTRDRLLSEAMRLFGQQGYRATSVAQIEAAAGLAPGSGALYHHFTSKEALLDAGIDRQLDRRGAMRDVRALFAGLGNLDTELTLLGRYLFAVLDEETQLLQIAARTPVDQSARAAAAYAALVDGLCAELSDWIAGWAPQLAAGDSQRIAEVAVNALLGNRVGRMLYHDSGAQLRDEDYLTEWTTLLAARIRA